MSVTLTAQSRRRQWHVDGINGATDEIDRLGKAMALARAELKRCEVERPADAVGLCRQLAHVIATFALDVHRVHPAPEFLGDFPLLPGGGWSAKPHSGARRP